MQLFQLFSPPHELLRVCRTRRNEAEAKHSKPGARPAVMSWATSQTQQQPPTDTNHQPPHPHRVGDEGHMSSSANCRSSSLSTTANCSGAVYLRKPSASTHAAVSIASPPPPTTSQPSGVLPVLPVVPPAVLPITSVSGVPRSRKPTISCSASCRGVVAQGGSTYTKSGCKVYASALLPCRTLGSMPKGQRF